ncbi:hypothetical protein [Catenulispora rubra]|uniref:hypothetical protein n=1 Tax=Catenulispora rubra TaxID=280293 RepID=UPI0018926EFA|nr:hypothetical protein [Catenulispora rubra]
MLITGDLLFNSGTPFCADGLDHRRDQRVAGRIAPFAPGPSLVGNLRRALANDPNNQVRSAVRAALKKVPEQ